MTGPAKFLDIILYSRNEIHQENVVRYPSSLFPSLLPFLPPFFFRAFYSPFPLSLPPSLHQARGMAHLNKETDAPWGIMRVKAQDVERELPMLPTTLIRNALGKEFGGSGVALDVERYKESVAFWMDHAAIR